MRRIESLDPTTELAWLKVVVKHEALAVRRSRPSSFAERRPRRGRRRPRPAPPDRRPPGQSRARRALRRGPAPHQAGRGPRAHAQGERALLRGDRSRAPVDIHEGQPVPDGRPRPVPEGLRRDRGGRVLRALRPDPRRARGRHRFRGCAPRAPAAHPQLRRLPSDRAGAACDAPRPPARVLADPGALGWVTGRGGIQSPMSSRPAAIASAISSQRRPGPLRGDLARRLAAFHGDRDRRPEPLARVQGARLRVDPADARARMSSHGAGRGGIERRRPCRDARRDPRALPQQRRRGHGLRRQRRPPESAGRRTRTSAREVCSCLGPADAGRSSPRAEARAPGARSISRAASEAVPQAVEARLRGVVRPSGPSSHEQPTVSSVPAGTPAVFTFEGPAQPQPQQPAATPATGGGEFAP